MTGIPMGRNDFNKIVKPRCYYGRLRTFIDEFISSDAEVMELKYEDTYETIKSAYDSIRYCIRRNFKGSVELHLINGKLYLEKL